MIQAVELRSDCLSFLLNLIVTLAPNPDVFLNDLFEGSKHGLELLTRLLVEGERLFHHFVVLLADHLHELRVLLEKVK